MTADIPAAAARVRAAGRSGRRRGRDPVNQAMIRGWQEALGDHDPRYEADGVAPPAMIQVWTMPGLRGARTDDDPLGRMTSLLDEAGFTSVVATNCTQVYHRELRVGEQVEVDAELGDVVGPKRTALGEGWFVTVASTWFVGDEPVAEMDFRILKFRPPPPPAPVVPRPVVSRDTEFFWAGTALRELRIQRCENCDRLRHPPGPVCPACGSDNLGHVLASGTGTVYSFVVHHHPPTPGRTPPYVVALVELTEGVRILGELLTDDPAAVAVGKPVELVWQDGGDDLLLPAWRAT
jgi:3-oxo-4,17-pregnadiene-20-carboxyl-CoA hydratase alpha subunit